MSEQVRAMFANIADRYDTGNTVLSFGVHHYWRKRTVKHSEVKVGDSVLDCATGTGDLAIEYNKHVGVNGTVVGTDFCDEMLDIARQKEAQEKYGIDFAIADAMNLPYESDSFDIASISFGIRNVDNPVQCLREMARVVRPGGKVVVLEFGQPKGLFALPYKFYSETLLPFVGGLVTGDREAYSYLQRTSANFPCREEFLALMKEADSYSAYRYIPLTFGISYLYIGTVR
jgi:demethylmenaquinone methyltransferase/2-methoxy-6-polyprenyl-1,4-benzoquinol methylase